MSILTMPNIRLRAFEREDLEIVLRWVNDEEVTKYLSDSLIYPVSRADEMKWIESISNANHKEKILAVETLKGELIGSIGLTNINWVERKAEMGIMIGEKDHWNKGYGSDAVREILRLAFERMNLNRIYLRVFENNPRAIRVYERCGFRKEGTLRHDHFHGQQYFDTIIMGILRSEYVGKTTQS